MNTRRLSFVHQPRLTRVFATAAAALTVAYGAATVPTAAAAAPAKRVDPPPVLSAPLPPLTVPPVTGDGSQPPAPPESGIDRPNRPPSFDPKTSKLVASETTETKQVWANSDGSQTVELDASPARVRDPKTNSWVDVDLSLVAGGDGSLGPKAAPGAARIGANATGDATIATPAGTVRLRHVGAASVAAAVAGDQASYKAALGGRDVALMPTSAGGVEETVTLAGPSASGTYQDQLVLPPGATATTPPTPTAGPARATPRPPRRTA